MIYNSINTSAHNIEKLFRVELRGNFEKNGKGKMKGILEKRGNCFL